MGFEDFAAYYEAAGLPMEEAIAAAMLALEAEGEADAP